MEGTAPPRIDQQPAFAIGDVVRHRRLGVRAVVVDIHSSLPPLTDGNAAVPSYELLLHNSARIVISGEDGLEPDLTCLPIASPLIHVFFHTFRQGRYVLTGAAN